MLSDQKNKNSMKYLKLITLLFAGSFFVTTAFAQANAYVNILTLNSGYVSQAGLVEIQVTVGNTGPVSSIAANKVRAQISVPSALVSLLPNAQQTGLPAGWTITVNTGSAITVCNGSDIIAPGSSRDLFIKVQGNSIGGPSTVNANLLFSSGTSCTTPGSLSGDNTADNSSTSSIQVFDPIPLTLTDFKATAVNCQPVLNWNTENEINSSRFDIEKTNSDQTGWSLIGTVAAKGNSTGRASYNFIDQNPAAYNQTLLYRLKIIDNDGRFKYSNIANTVINCKTVDITVYPAPVTDGKLFINISGLSGYTETNLLSITGQSVLTSKLENGINYLNVQHLAAGVYILAIKDKQGLDKKVKVLIQ